MLVRVQKEVRSMIEEVYRLGEYVYFHKLNIGKNMNIEGTAQGLRKK